ncbi:MAG: pilus assembly protein HicB [Alistipes sp.]|nr:pilus assembly protein HicB [Alistipes sp.]
MKKVVKVVVERGQDGLFSAYCPDYAYNGKHSFGGFGDTAMEAKEDFLLSVSETKEICEELGESTKEFEYLSFEWEYDLPSMFGCFPYLNISRFADMCGVNSSKMRQYASGVATPSAKTANRINTALQQIALDLSGIRLL